jgi:structure-specific endonuclease subunit SLX1
MTEKAWASYLLITCAEPIQTYVGATVDVNRRLRQHNAEISGGARRTTAIAINRGSGAWKRVCHCVGFVDKIECLKFEWYWKHFSRKQTEKDPLARRLVGLQNLLAIERWHHIEVVWETGYCPVL